MPKYRTKPVEIEAVQMTPELRHVPLAWPPWLKAAWKLRPVRPGSLHVVAGQLLINTPQGDMLVELNDWIVNAGHGQIAPCAADTFQQYYEAVN